MKFAIPLAAGQLTAHFGHCKSFAFVEVQNHQIISQVELEPPPHEPGVLPRWLHEQGVTHVIAGGLGQKAQQLLVAQGINITVGAPVADPQNLVRQFLNGTLASGNNLCDH